MFQPLDLVLQSSINSLGLSTGKCGAPSGQQGRTSYLLELGGIALQLLVDMFQFFLQATKARFASRLTERGDEKMAAPQTKQNTPGRL